MSELRPDEGAFVSPPSELESVSDGLEAQSSSDSSLAREVEVVIDAIIPEGSTGTRGSVRLAMASSISFLRIRHWHCFYVACVVT